MVRAREQLALCLALARDVARMAAVKVKRAAPVALAGLALGGCGDRTGVLTDEVSTVAVDAGTIINVDAAADAVVGVVVCGVPAGGGCALCNGLYYCPEWPPAPPCSPSPDLQPYQSCTSSCIACPSDGVQESDQHFANDAWLWHCCGPGEMGPSGGPGTYCNIFSLGYTCQ